MHCRKGKVDPPAFALRMVPLPLRKAGRECWLYDEGQKKANVMKADARGLSSVSLAADSSLCGGSLLGEAASADAAVEYPQSCALRMTAPSAEGAKGDFASAEARRWLSDRPSHSFGLPLIDWH